MINECKTDYKKFVDSENSYEETNAFLRNGLDHRVFIEKTNDNNYKYKLKILVGNFVPADFKLKLKGNTLFVTAIRENLTHTNNQYSLQSNLKEIEEFKREINLPDFVLLDSVICYLEVYEDDQNFLYIEAEINEVLDNSAFRSRKSLFNSSSNKSKLNNYTNLNSKTYKSIDQINEKLVENYSTNGCLKYKFELKEFDSKNVSISIKNKNILVVYAFTTYLDLNGRPAIREFHQEIQLPDNIELRNIRNCFDESLGVLRIEIPLKTNNKKNNNLNDSDVDIDSITDYPDGRIGHENENDKYLELMFDLKDFKFENIDFSKNVNDKNVLIVKAYKLLNSNRKAPFIRKYVLPGLCFVLVFNCGFEFFC
jgi:HSP20 family molecular chaperone IbpA